MYYIVVVGELWYYVCIFCYNEMCVNIVIVDGIFVLKLRFEKKKNDEEVEELVCFF